MDENYQKMMVVEIDRLDRVIRKLSKWQSRIAMAAVGVYIDPRMRKTQEKIGAGIRELIDYREEIFKDLHELDDDE